MKSWLISEGIGSAFYLKGHHLGIKKKELSQNKFLCFLTDILSCSIKILHFRILWSIFFFFTCYYGYLLYTPFLNTWNYEPTVIGIDQADFRVEKIPFPAITICSNNKIVYRQLESVLRTQPWRGLVKLNYNITQETTDKGMFLPNIR